MYLPIAQSVCGVRSMPCATPEQRAGKNWKGRPRQGDSKCPDCSGRSQAIWRVSAGSGPARLPPQCRQPGRKDRPGRRMPRRPEMANTPGPGRPSRRPSPISRSTRSADPAPNTHFEKHQKRRTGAHDTLREAQEAPSRRPRSASRSTKGTDPAPRVQNRLGSRIKERIRECWTLSFETWRWW